ncbi:hypothetical protein CM49_00906 [Paenibacillus sp. P1XP2]|nr:hypothetical protein CM49_00906 [Paenibacillus sp. P1XP2]
MVGRGLRVRRVMRLVCLAWGSLRAVFDAAGRMGRVVRHPAAMARAEERHGPAPDVRPRRDVRRNRRHGGGDRVPIVSPRAWLAVEDYYTGGSSRQILFPGFRRRLAYRCELRSLPRGVYSFDACRLEWGGLFGWFKGERVQKSEGNLLVLPKPLPVAGLSESPAAEAYGAAQPAQTMERRQGVKGPEVRPYLPTDPMNRIHWKSYAKRGSLDTFLPEDERDPHCLVVLDRSYAGYVAWEGTDEERVKRAKRDFEQAVSAAAGIVSEMRRSGAKGKLVCGASDPLASFAAAPAEERISGSGGYSRMLAALSSVELAEGSALGSLLETELRHAAPGTRVLLITGTLSEPTSEAAARLLARGVQVHLYCTALNAGWRRLTGNARSVQGNLRLLRRPFAFPGWVPESMPFILKA